MKRVSRPIKAFILDFDGTILDTESADFIAWKSVCAALNVPFPKIQLLNSVGSSEQFFPECYIAENAHHAISPAEVKKLWNDQFESLVAKLKVPSGFISFLNTAAQRSIHLAVASSSSSLWVIGHLTRLNIAHYFKSISTQGDVLRLKPAPDLYEHSLRSLNCTSEEAVAIEDSLNGVNAAKGAGLFTVWIPNEVTNMQNITVADLTAKSFSDLDFDTICKHHAQHHSA